MQCIRCTSLLLQVFKLAYCGKFEAERVVQCQRICVEFVQAVQITFPEMLQKPKIHLLLHLIDSMRDFGPASGFNTERFVTLSNTAKEHYDYACGLYFCRCESYLSQLRHQNIYSNRQAPSRDIAEAFVKLEHLRFVCSGGLFDGRFDC